jgi:hypothetical protein
MAAAKKKENKPIKTGTSSRHITNLKQSILETFDIYGLPPGDVILAQLACPLIDVIFCLTNLSLTNIVELTYMHCVCGWQKIDKIETRAQFSKTF